MSVPSHIPFHLCLCEIAFPSACFWSMCDFRSKVSLLQTACIWVLCLYLFSYPVSSGCSIQSIYSYSDDRWACASCHSVNYFLAIFCCSLFLSSLAFFPCDSMTFSSITFIFFSSYYLCILFSSILQKNPKELFDQSYIISFCLWLLLISHSILQSILS